MLKQLMEVMKGNAPTFVITDGDMVRINAMTRVFPKAHHKLCDYICFRMQKETLVVKFSFLNLENVC